ncbi:hypothetical protein GCM10008997_38910 [Halomonas salifodinae]
MGCCPLQTASKPYGWAASAVLHECVKSDRFSAQAGRGVDGAPWGAAGVGMRWASVRDEKAAQVMGGG